MICATLSGTRTADLDAGTHHGEFTGVHWKTVDLCADEADGEVPRFRRCKPNSASSLRAVTSRERDLSVIWPRMGFANTNSL
jgi:hypothetical protein